MAVYHGIIHHNGTHSNQYIVVNGTAMHQCIMTNGNMITDIGRVFLVCTVNNCSVLNIYFVSYFNIVYITTNYRIEPYTAVVTHYHIADNCGIGGNKTIFTQLRMFTKNTQYNWHKITNFDGER